MARLPAPPDPRNPAPGRCAETPSWRGPGSLQVSLAIRPPPGTLLLQHRVPVSAEQPRPPGSAPRRTPRLSPPSSRRGPRSAAPSPAQLLTSDAGPGLAAAGALVFLLPPYPAQPPLAGPSLSAQPLPLIGCPRWIYEWGEEATCCHRRLELTAHCPAPQSTRRSICLAPVAARRTCCCYTAASASAAAREKPAAFKLAAV